MTSLYVGKAKGRWPIHHNPDDITRVYFRDPDTRTSSSSSPSSAGALMDASTRATHGSVATSSGASTSSTRADSRDSRNASVCRLVGQRYHRAVTLAAIWSAIFNAESAGLALHVLMSIMTLFLSASARPQPQPGALAFC